MSALLVCSYVSQLSHLTNPNSNGTTIPAIRETANSEAETHQCPEIFFFGAKE